MTSRFYGFLPTKDPLESLANSRWQYIPLVSTLENLSITLPQLVEERRFREEVVYQLRRVSSYFDDDFVNQADVPYLERLMLIYSYFASAYVYARHENTANRIPKEISVPLVKIAKQLGRHPILSYASYCLNNWRRLDLEKPITLGNIELLQNFCTSSFGKVDEDWFILVHVEIEARATEGITAINELYLTGKAGLDDELFLLSILRRLCGSMALMNAALARMPERCSPDNYYKFVRPYIFGFKNVVYEGCFLDKPQSFRGETGAQSSIIPAILPVLGVKHKDSMLTQHLQEMREYMPWSHRFFLEQMESYFAREGSVRDSVLKLPSLKILYNECVQQLLDFRTMHFQYAVNYIATKVTNPEGTGGTPYIPWLQQLKDETAQYFVE